MHSVVVPDSCIEMHQSRRLLAAREEVVILNLLNVPFVNIYGQNKRTSGDNTGSEIKEHRVIQLKLADLERHIVDCLI